MAEGVPAMARPTYDDNSTPTIVNTEVATGAIQWQADLAAAPLALALDRSSQIVIKGMIRPPQLAVALSNHDVVVLNLNDGSILKTFSSRYGKSTIRTSSMAFGDGFRRWPRQAAVDGGHKVHRRRRESNCHIGFGLGCRPRQTRCHGGSPRSDRIFRLESVGHSASHNPTHQHHGTQPETPALVVSSMGHQNRAHEITENIKFAIKNRQSKICNLFRQRSLRRRNPPLPRINSHSLSQRPSRRFERTFGNVVAI